MGSRGGVSRFAGVLGLILVWLGTSGFNVFGRDDRYEMRSNQYPWSTIGKVRSSTGQCTGTLVGKNLVLTAAHCVVDSKTHQLKPGRVEFLANMQGGRSSLSSVADYAWVGTWDTASERGHDWAVLRLVDPIGETAGYLGFQAMNFTQVDPAQNYTLAAYSSDFMSGRSAGVHEGCHVIRYGDDAGTVFHDCDMTAGASGGSLFTRIDGDWRVAAINVAHRAGEDGKSVFGAAYNDRIANIAVSAEVFSQKLEEIRQAEDKRLAEIKR